MDQKDGLYEVLNAARKENAYMSLKSQLFIPGNNEIKQRPNVDLESIVDQIDTYPCVIIALQWAYIVIVNIFVKIFYVFMYFNFFTLA